MQFKPLPAPPTDPIATVEAVRAALPREPDPDLDCCARVTTETTIESRDVAADWLTFLRALELAVDEPDGYRSEPVDGDLDPATLGSAFRRRIVGADAVLDAVERARGPVTAGDVFDRLDAGDEIPRSARRRHGDELEGRWTDRVERLLDWAVAFDQIERVEDGYRTSGP